MEKSSLHKVLAVCAAILVAGSFATDAFARGGGHGGGGHDGGAHMGGEGRMGGGNFGSRSGDGSRFNGFDRNLSGANSVDRGRLETFRDARIFEGRRDVRHLDHLHRDDVASDCWDGAGVPPRLALEYWICG